MKLILLFLFFLPYFTYAAKMSNTSDEPTAFVRDPYGHFMLRCTGGTIKNPFMKSSLDISYTDADQIRTVTPPGAISTNGKWMALTGYPLNIFLYKKSLQGYRLQNKFSSITNFEDDLCSLVGDLEFDRKDKAIFYVSTNINEHIQVWKCKESQSPNLVHTTKLASKHLKKIGVDVLRSIDRGNLISGGQDGSVEQWDCNKPYLKPVWEQEVNKKDWPISRAITDIEYTKPNMMIVAGEYSPCILAYDNRVSNKSPIWKIQQKNVIRLGCSKANILWTISGGSTNGIKKYDIRQQPKMLKKYNIKEKIRDGAICKVTGKVALIQGSNQRSLSLVETN